MIVGAFDFLAPRGTLKESFGIDENPSNSSGKLWRITRKIIDG